MTQNTSEVNLIGLKYNDLKRHIDNLSELKSNLKDENEKTLKHSITLVERHFSKITPLFVNKIHISNTLKKHVKECAEDHLSNSGKISNIDGISTIIVKEIEAHYNKLILSSKRDDSRHNRIVEKSELIRFFRTNTEQLKMFLELLNLLRDVKLTATKKG